MARTLYSSEQEESSRRDHEPHDKAEADDRGNHERHRFQNIGQDPDTDGVTMRHGSSELQDQSQHWSVQSCLG